LLVIFSLSNREILPDRGPIFKKLFSLNSANKKRGF
jgi:hypothetical protein